MGLLLVYEELIVMSHIESARELRDRLAPSLEYDPGIMDDKGNSLLPENLIEYAFQYRFGLHIEITTSMVYETSTWISSLQVSGSTGGRLLVASATCRTKVNSVRAMAMNTFERHFPDLYDKHKEYLMSFTQIADLISITDHCGQTDPIVR